MDFKSDSKAASEIIGEMLLLVIVVVLAGVLSSNIASLIPSVRDTAYVEMLAVSENGSVNITHIGGEPLNLAEVKLMLDDEVCGFNGTTLDCETSGRLFGNGDDLWEFGERLQVNSSVSRISVIYHDQIVCKIFV
ncbi:type IV pilin [Archaeoglobus sp.]